MITFGFIGTGSMGGILAQAVCKSVNPQQVFLSNRTPEKALALAQQLGCNQTDNASVFADCDYIFLGVKPYMITPLLQQAKDILAARTTPPVLISMAAGVTIAQIEAAAGALPVIRIMPNTPAAVGEGMTVYDINALVTQEQLDCFLDSMKYSGCLDQLSESLIDAASAVAGCGPAYAYMILEALADGGVACGLPRAKALQYASQMLLGSAKYALESGKHPGALKDAVCSPGGSTIAGVHALEKGSLRGTMMNAVIAAWEKGRTLGK